MTTTATARVARDLTEILEMSDLLHDRAMQQAGHKLMPGGNAMVALGPVSSPGQWAEQLDDLEEAAYATSHAYGVDIEAIWPVHDEQPDDWEPPLQTLLYWSERWRQIHRYPRRDFPTLESESAFIKWALDWAVEEEPRWREFTADIERAKRRLEDVLHRGTRAVARGVTCLYCRTTRLIRTTIPTRGPNGEKAWKLTDWHCPRCKRSWDDNKYAAMIFAEIDRHNYDTFDGDLWCTVGRAALITGRGQPTIRSWMQRQEVASACQISTRRIFVSRQAVEARDQLAKDRRRRTLENRTRNSRSLETTPL